MRIAISFHSPSLSYARRGGILCLVLGVVVAATTAALAWAVYADTNRWNADLQALTRQRATPVAALEENSTVEMKTELQAANQIIERLNTPWSALFESLETVYSENAILLALDPDPVSRSLRLTAESKDSSSMLEFVRQLRAAKVFADAYVVSHAINQSDMQRPIRFSVASHWLDAPPKPVHKNIPGESESAAPDTTATPQQVVKPEGDAS